MTAFSESEVTFYSWTKSYPAWGWKRTGLARKGSLFSIVRHLRKGRSFSGKVVLCCYIRERQRKKAINGKCSRSIFNNLGQSFWRKSRRGRGELYRSSTYKWKWLTRDEQVCVSVCMFVCKKHRNVSSITRPTSRGILRNQKPSVCCFVVIRRNLRSRVIPT